MNEEQWKGCPGFDGRYEVSNTGKVRSLSRLEECYRGSQRYFFRVRARELKQSPDKYGYSIVILSAEGCTHTRKVHRLVAETFLLKPSRTDQVNHKNGVKNDNREENLEWVSAKQNVLHSFQTLGRKALRGEKVAGSKLSEAQVLEIRKRAAGDETQASLAEEFNVSVMTISLIHRRVNWAWLK